MPTTGLSRRAAVLGSPIAHSLSPVLHRAAYDALGLAGWSYDRVECDETGLARFVATLDETWAGLSLTMPLKRVALEVAEEVSELAASVGAANTLTRMADGRWRADNTDVIGVEQALREIGVPEAPQAIVLGAGGTAQACLPALRSLGCREPLVLVRDVGRTSELRAAAERLGIAVQVRAGLAPQAVLPPADIVISTLPAGAADGLSCDAATRVVLDVVYAPWPTDFARTADAGGAKVQSGLAMLLHQAAAQVRLMTGLEPPVDAMRRALAAATRPARGH
jgi:shikimate dehydrogenase